jgi:DNA-binding NarL/FixJ family response regulator
MSPLTVRELQVVALIVKGYRSKVIAQELGVALGTIKLHLNKIYQKKQVAGRVALIISELNTKSETNNENLRTVTAMLSQRSDF